MYNYKTKMENSYDEEKQMQLTKQLTPRIGALKTIITNMFLPLNLNTFGSHAGLACPAELTNEED